MVRGWEGAQRLAFTLSILWQMVGPDRSCAFTVQDHLCLHQWGSSTMRPQLGSGPTLLSTTAIEGQDQLSRSHE